jgi:hypothetical protein
MPFSLSSESDIAKLNSSVEWSLTRLKPYRLNRVEMLRRYVGKHYASDGSKDNRPINLLELGVKVFIQGLASHNPQVQVFTDFQDLTPYALDLELVMNQQLPRMDIRDGFNTCVMESMFCLGVMEVGITGADTPPDGEGNLYDPGHLFADPILFDDLILDMTARHWDQQSYIGHEYVVPYDWVKSNPNFDQDVVDKITAPEHETTDPSERYEERQGLDQEFEDTITLRQIFLPRQKKVLTFAPSVTGDQPLQVIDWKGPERGPYHRLSLGKVPGRLIPLAPVSLWWDLDDIVNRCYNKAADQALRQKSIALADDQGIGERTREASDGDMIYCTNPESVKEVSYGGANQLNLAMAMWSKQMLNLVGGNWEAIAGLAPQAKTVGQEQLLTAGASGRLREMQDTVIEFQTAVIQDLAFWLFNDPVSEYHIVKPVGNTGYGVPAVFSPESRVGEYFNYNFRCNPYSMRNTPPAEEAGQLISLLTQVILPSLPVMMQQGIALDWEKIFKSLSHKMNLPELNNFIQYMNGQQVPAKDAVGMPQSTTRTYERVNRSAATQQGGEQEMMRMLMGAAGGGGQGVDLPSMAMG